MAKTKLVKIVTFCQLSRAQNIVKNARNTEFHESFGTFKNDLGISLFTLH